MAAAGRASDTHEIAIHARPIGIEVTPGEADLVSLGETATVRTSADANSGMVELDVMQLHGHWPSRTSSIE